MKQITIDRYNGDTEVCLNEWKDLISSLVLVGYEVYGDKDRIVFKLGNDDIVKEI